MKKSMYVALAVVAVGASLQFGGNAMAMPDSLVNAAPKATPVPESVVLVPVANPDTEAAVDAFVNAWEYTQAKLVAIQDKKEKGEKLTAEDKAWLESNKKNTYSELFNRNLKSRVNFYKNSHNWNGENKHDREYNYMTLPAYSDEKGYADSYGYAVLSDLANTLGGIAIQYAETNGPATPNAAASLKADLLKAMNEEGNRVNNSELRSYMNETLWFAAKQTVKDKNRENPKEAHKVDLRAAINDTESTEK